MLGYKEERTMNTKRHIKWMDGAWPLLFVLVLTGALVTAQAVPARANDREKATQIVEKACMTLDNFMQDKHMGPFRDLLKKAKAVVIVPSLLKGAFIIGASGGSGVAVVRETKSGQWSQPGFYTVGGASFGLQIGGQASEVILLAMTERGVKALMGSSFKLGADAGIAAGPVGMGAQAASANLSADILSFSRSKGLYGGISLDGSVVAVRASLNKAYYNKKVSPTDIFVRHEVTEPQSACLIRNLARSSGK